MRGRIALNLARERARVRASIAEAHRIMEGLHLRLDMGGDWFWEFGLLVELILR